MLIKKKSLIPVLFSVLFLAIAAGSCQKDENVGVVGVCPQVLATNPGNGATGVPRNQVITATFNEKVNPATINNSSFTVQGAAKITGIVTYDDATAKISFTPAAPLDSNTTYTGRVASAVKDMAGNALQSDYIWTFSTGSTLSPMVISTDPANSETGVVLNKVVTATFSVPMDPATITTATFTLKQGAASIAGTVAYSGTTASFQPSALLTSNTTYTGTITTGAKNTSGTSLDNDYVWTFTTGSLKAPYVVSTDPANNATGVALNKMIMATFNEPMAPLTISPATFTVMKGSVSVPGSTSYNNVTATFTPSSPLLPNTTYTGTITTGATNVAGTHVANNYTWTFTTGAASNPEVTSTDPLNNATGVALNKTATATFNMPMDPLTITGSTFLLKQGVSSVSGIVSYSGTTASFKPSANLLAGKTYTATITTGAKNLAGIPLANDYVWSFDTRADNPPVIDLKSAADFGILAYTGITNNAGFSEIHDMNVGIYPGVRTGITGFPPGKVVNGAIYASDDLMPVGIAALLKQAKKDLTDAYLAAEGATTPAPATVSGDLGGTTLAPGIYKSTSTLMIQSGDLTLDAQGDPNATWIFQVAAGFTTVGGAGGNIILSGGAQAKNVFWQVGSSATIGDGTSFKGNILALTSITMNSDAVAEGRMLAINGAVSLTSTNIITKP